MTTTATPAQELLPSPVVVEMLMDFLRVLARPSRAAGKPALWPYQETFCRRIFRDIVEGWMSEVTGLFARQTGKTECLALVSLTCMAMLPALARAFPHDPRFHRFVNGFLVGIYAPVDHQANICFERAVKTYSKAELEAVVTHPDLNAGIVRYSGGRLVLENGSRLLARTASVNSNIEGDTHHLIIMDEAQDLDKEKVQKSLHPMGAQTGATMAKIGTPENSRSDFYEAICRNIERDNSLRPEQRALRRHFEFDCTQGAACNPTYAQYVEEERVRLGEHSIAFRLKYLLQWHFDTDLAFDSPTLAKLLDVSRPFLYSWDRSATVAGWDVAKERNLSVVWCNAPDFSRPIMEQNLLPQKKGGSANDEAVHAMCYPKSMIGCLEMEGTNYEGQYPQVVAFCRRMNVRRLVVDMTGVGNPVVERIQLLLPDVEVVGVSWHSYTVKSFVYTFYLQECHAGRVTFPASEAARQTGTFQRFYEEHKMLTKRWAGNYMLCEKPDDDSADDHCDAAALSVWGSKDALAGGPVQVEVSDLFGRSRGGSILDQAARELAGSIAASRSDRYRRGRR